MAELIERCVIKCREVKKHRDYQQSHKTIYGACCRKKFYPWISGFIEKEIRECKGNHTGKQQLPITVFIEGLTINIIV